MLNSVIKTKKIEQFWTQIKDIQLDQPSTKQFSQNSWLWVVPVNEIIFSIQATKVIVLTRCDYVLRKLTGLESPSFLKQDFFKGAFLDIFKKNFKNFLNSSSGGYLVEAVAWRYSIKLAFSIACSFIKKETPAQVLLWEFYKYFQNTIF